MLIVILLFILGLGVGWFIRRWIKSTKPIDIMVTVAIWLLLFILGVGVGANHQIMSNFQMLGWWALVIAFGATAGSIAAVAVVQRIFFKREEATDER